MYQKKKVLFLGESQHPIAQPWISGLKEYGNFEIIPWQLPSKKGMLGRVQRVAAWVTAQRTLRKKIKQERYDLVIAYRLSSYGYLARAAVGLAPVIVAQQGISDIFPLNSIVTPFKRFLVKKAIQNANLINLWGVAMVSDMIKKYADPQKVFIMAKGVDLGNFYPAPELQVPAQRVEAIVTRSIREFYRHIDIIKAVQIVRDQNIPIHVNMMGDGPLLEELKAETSRLSLDNNITWHGRIPNSLLPEYLRKCNYYLSVPSTEGVSSSLMEAMACNLYPIVSDVAGNKAQITDKANGRLIEVGNHEALATAIIETFRSPSERATAIKQNQLYIEAHGDYHKNMPQMMRKYHSIIEEWNDRKKRGFV